MTIAKQLWDANSFRDPARFRLLETRKAVVAHWTKIADALDAQGEVALAGDVRYFAHKLPQVMTDGERIALHLVRHFERTRMRQTPVSQNSPDKSDDFTR
ncbi:MAG: hypothetical protein ACREVV_07755 [Steroidobacteraceae bacterium]